MVTEEVVNKCIYCGGDVTPGIDSKVCKVCHKIFIEKDEIRDSRYKKVGKMVDN